MTKQAPVSSGFPALDRLDQFLSEDDHLTSLVLRGHLIIEEQLTKLLRRALAYPDAILEARLSFSQLLAVVKGLYYRPKAQPIWVAIQRLNTLRNQLAHRLEPQDLENRLRDLVNTLVCDMPAGMQRDHPDVLGDLNLTLGFLCAALDGMLHQSDRGVAAVG